MGRRPSCENTSGAGGPRAVESRAPRDTLAGEMASGAARQYQDEPSSTIGYIVLMVKNFAQLIRIIVTEISSLSSPMRL